MSSLLRRMGRVTGGARYLPEVDGLRFVAILAVVLVHLSDDLVLRHGLLVPAGLLWVFAVLSHGNRGVQLFFTISGFILALPFARRGLRGEAGPALGKYLSRRLTRLEVPYLLNVLVLSAATWLALPIMRGHVLTHALAAVTYSHGVVFHARNPLGVMWWSLEIEAQFYVLMPLLARVFWIRSAWVRRGAMAAVALVLPLVQVGATSKVVDSSNWVSTCTILGSLQFFLVGMLVADLYESGLVRQGLRWGWDVLGIGALLVWFGVGEHWAGMAPVLALVILMTAFEGRLVRGVLARPWVAATGGMCYSIYLWHMFVMALCLKFSLRWMVADRFWFSLVSQAALVLPTIFGVSVLMFLLVEKPCMNPDWPRTLLGRVRGQREVEVEVEGAMAA